MMAAGAALAACNHRVAHPILVVGCTKESETGQLVARAAAERGLVVEFSLPEGPNKCPADFADPMEQLDRLFRPPDIGPLMIQASKSMESYVCMREDPGVRRRPNQPWYATRKNEKKNKRFKKL